MKQYLRLQKGQAFVNWKFASIMAKWTTDGTAGIAMHASTDLKDMKRDRDVEAFRFLLKRTKRERAHLSGRGNWEGEEAAKTCCNPIETSQTAECEVFVFLFLILFWWQRGVRVRRRYIPFFIDPCTALRIYSEVKVNSEGFAVGPVVMNLLADEGDTSSIPGPGRSHMPQSS